jgi:hypothetical protein
MVELLVGQRTEPATGGVATNEQSVYPRLFAGATPKIKGL